jgi:hypothetical protein
MGFSAAEATTLLVTMAGRLVSDVCRVPAGLCRSFPTPGGRVGDAQQSRQTDGHALAFVTITA